MKLKENNIILVNWLTLNKFFEIEGTCNSLLSLKVIWESLGDTKDEEPVLEMLKPSFPIKIWSSPSKWDNCLICWDSPITWKLGPEFGIHVELAWPFSWDDEFVIIKLGWLVGWATNLELGLT